MDASPSLEPTEWSAALEARGLRCAGRYARSVTASLERVWENVLDWEHLPWLHASAFASIERLESGRWGWRARVVPRRAGGSARSQVIEVRIERERGRYVSATVEGPGSGTEIWTQLRVLGPDCTGVEVQFWVPEREPARLASLGRSLVGVYERLWDEDEHMMMRRSAELAARQRESAAGPLELALGPLEALRARLPVRVELGGRGFRIVEVRGELFAHATRCPHLLGPLEEAPVEADCSIRCPWHGYRFDVRTGASLDGRRLRLAPSARVDVDPLSGEVVLRVQDPGAP